MTADAYTAEVQIRRKCFHPRAERWANAVNTYWKCPDCGNTTLDKNSNLGYIYEWVPLISLKQYLG